MIKTQLTVNDNSDKVKEVKTTWDEKEANELLKKGWTFIHAGVAHKDELGYCAKPIFVLARLE